MTTIHLEVERVQELLQQMSTTAARLDGLYGNINSARSQLSYAWQGGHSEAFQYEFRRLLNQYSTQCQNIDNLILRANREVDEWISKDQFDPLDIGSIPVGIGIVGVGTGVYNGNEIPTGFLPWIIEHGKIGIGFGENGYRSKTGKQSWRRGKYESKAEVRLGVGDAWYEDKNQSVGKWEVGAKAGMGKKGYTAGVYEEGSVYEAHGAKVFGSSIFGFTLTGGVAAGSGEAFAGIKDSSLGASAGGGH